MKKIMYMPMYKRAVKPKGKFYLRTYRPTNVFEALKIQHIDAFTTYGEALDYYDRIVPRPINTVMTILCDLKSNTGEILFSAIT